MSNIQEAVPQEKDSMSSSFELRLGQPSQQRHAIGGPLSDPLDSRVSSAAIERQKSIFLQRMLQRGNAKLIYCILAFKGCNNRNFSFYY